MGYKIKKVRIRPNGVEKQIYPATWHPGANTVAYYPLTADFNDAIGNYNMTTKAGTPSITKFNGVKCLYLNGSSDIGTDSLTTSVIGQTFTISAWAYITSGGGKEVAIFTNRSGSNGYFLSIYYGQTFGTWSQWNGTNIQDTNPLSTNTWYHICLTSSGGTIKHYVNGTLVKTGSATPSLYSNSKARIGGTNMGSREEYFSTGYESELILEKVAWTDLEITEYYNQTKSNYGL